jgi:ribosomal protein L7Ae-like RNA K-turn-binding protein
VPAEELEAARAKGKLAGLLKRAFKVSELSVSDDIVTRIRDGLEKATLDRLGLEARASNLLSGAEKVDAAARGGAVELLLHASDASDDGAAKRDQSWRVGLEEEGSGKKGMRLPVDRDRLSAALGRANSVHVAITDAKAAERVKHHLERWLYFIGCSNARGDAKADRRAQTAPDGN